MSINRIRLNNNTYTLPEYGEYMDLELEALFDKIDKVVNDFSFLIDEMGLAKDFDDPGMQEAANQMQIYMTGVFGLLGRKFYQRFDHPGFADVEYTFECDICTHKFKAPASTTHCENCDHPLDQFDEFDEEYE